MKQHIKSICAAIVYIILFHVTFLGGFASYARGSMTYFLWAVLGLVMVPVYFFTKKHMEKRKTFHFATLLAHLLLCVLTWFFMDRIMGELEFLIRVIIGLFLYGVMNVFFLKELLAEQFRDVRGKRKSRSA